ncbi:hypothetical protein J3459_018138 [Metarhizium acridum]|nr:hypothetical protein J3459_018138 [Metarhizium acridum]
MGTKCGGRDKMPWWEDEKMADGQNKRICLAAVVVIKRTWPKTNTLCGKASPRLCASYYTAGFTERVEAVGNLRIAGQRHVETDNFVSGTTRMRAECDASPCPSCLAQAPLAVFTLLVLLASLHPSLPCVSSFSSLTGPHDTQHVTRWLEQGHGEARAGPKHGTLGVKLELT